MTRARPSRFTLASGSPPFFLKKHRANVTNDFAPRRRNRDLRYLFEDCALDMDRRELRRGPALLAVEPQVFDLLAHLIRHRDRVVPEKRRGGAAEGFPDRRSHRESRASRFKTSRPPK